MRHPFHPLLFVIYPLLALFSSNIGQVGEGVVIRPMAVSLLTMVVLLVVLRLLLGDWQKAAIVGTVTALFFFSYGHVHSLLRPIQFMGIVVGRHRHLLPIFLILYVLGISWIVRRESLSSATPWLNFAGSIAVLFPLLQLVRFEARIRAEPELSLVQLKRSEESLAVPTDQLPDIYYIILDAYTREDVLRDRFGIDNSEFTDELRDLGFYVADCSQSNYSQTQLAFATTLNFRYLEELGFSLGPGSKDRTRLFLLIRESAIRRILEGLGYTTVAFETGYLWSELEDADVYLGPDIDSGRAPKFNPSLSAFETLLLRSTALSFVVDAADALPEYFSPSGTTQAEAHKSRVLYVLDHLPDMVEIGSPKFVFAHIISPHSPFVLHPSREIVEEYVIAGSDVDAGDRFISDYRDQVIYLNTRFGDIFREIIDRSEIPPIIIIQGDHGAHGAAPDKRMAILLAMYLPGVEESELNYRTSPINLFRLILAKYLGYELELAQDKSYYSIYENPYDLTEIPNTCIA